jgi:hypothetical protein
MPGRELCRAYRPWRQCGLRFSHLDQPEPGVMRWTTPSGRHYTTRPTIYDT